MRYAIFSDVHANRQAWEAVRQDMEQLRVDVLVCLGDVVGYGPMPQEVLTAVREATENMVLGNHDAAACGRLDPSIFNDRAKTIIEWTADRLDEESIEFLKGVPLQMDGPGIQFVHAEMMEPGEYGYIDGVISAGLNLQAMTEPLGFIGHTHLPLAFAMPRKGGPVEELPDRDFRLDEQMRYIINVGSVGEPRTTDVRASYVVYDDVERVVRFRRVPFDIEGYRADLETAGLEIHPYFLQLVDAGVVEEETQAPAAPAPQLALAHLPKVAEVVAGHHGRLVVGPTGGAWTQPPGGSPVVAPPRTMPGWAIAAMVALALVVVAAVAVVLNRGDREVAAEGTPSTPAESPAKRQDERGSPASVAAMDPVEAVPGDAPPDDPSVVVDPDEPEPDEPARPPVVHEAPASLATGLVRYWPFDSPEASPSRFEQLEDGSVTEHLVAVEGQRLRFLVPRTAVSDDWMDPDFDDSSWEDGLNGVGYEDQAGLFEEHLETVLKDPVGKHPHSVLLRIPFEIGDPDTYEGLALYMRCDDGFAAYLNGRQIASRHLPDGPLQWNSPAKQAMKDEEAATPELFKVNRSMRFLKAGTNILAVHGLNSGGAPSADNRGSTSSDMLLQANLVALRKEKVLPEEGPAKSLGPHASVVESAAFRGEVAVVPGRFGEACEFRGGSIEIGEREKFAVSQNSLSLSLWFTRNPGSTDNEARRLISAGGGSDSKAGWALWISRKGDALTFVVGNGSRRSTVTARDDRLVSGEWRHVAVTVDRENEQVRIFLDGALAEEQRTPILRTSGIEPVSGLSIGRNSDDEQHHLGKLDEVAFWGRVLVPEEIAKIATGEQSLGERFAAEAE